MPTDDDSSRPEDSSPLEPENWPPPPRQDANSGSTPPTSGSSNPAYGVPDYGQPPTYAAPGYGQQPPTYAAPDYGQQPPAYAAPGYVQQPAGGPGQPYPLPGGPVPPGGEYPGYPAPYPGPGTSRWDGVSIAAFVTALLGLAIVPVVLGVLGIRRTAKNRTQGKWMAIVGVVLGAVEIVSWILVIVLAIWGFSQHRQELSNLHDSCAAGVMSDCDQLYWDSASGSADEQFAETCGGITTNAGGLCDSLSSYDDSTDSTDSTDSDGTGESPTDASSYGDDPTLDALWDQCQAGDGTACDDLYWQSPAGSAYEDFGYTCGNRVTEVASCEDVM